MAKLEELRQSYAEKERLYKQLLDGKDSAIQAIKEKRDEAVESYKKSSPRPECQLSERKFNTIHKKYTTANHKLQFRYKRSLGKIFLTSLLIAVAAYIVFTILQSVDIDIFEDSPEGQIAQIVASAIVPIFIFVIAAIKRVSAKATVKKCLRITEYSAWRDAVDAWAVRIDELFDEASKEIKAYDEKLNNSKKELTQLSTAISAEKYKLKEKTQQTSSAKPVTDSSAASFAQIIIVGDDPGLSTGAVGYITLDHGREILVPYSDYPQSYTVPSGKHHILITADPKNSPIYSVTAKLDREMDFTPGNILWVDIRSTYAKTEIDWKVISKAEFEKNIPAQARASIIKKGSIR